MAINAFEPFTTKLNQGVSLIEASAGTGKTFTIAMLVMRLVVELDIAIDKILVVTFTKAATEELKERIRSKLAETRAYLADLNLFEQDALGLWLTQCGLSEHIIKQRLELALLNIDQAGIFTIHGFCQRILSEHALASGQLFDAELTDDLIAIKQSCVDDFWRRELQNRPLWEAAVLAKDYKTPENMLASVIGVNAEACIYPQDTDLEYALLALKQSSKLAAEQVDWAVQAIRPYLDSDYFKAGYVGSFLANAAQLSAWLQGDRLPMPDANVLAMFSLSGISENLNGRKFLKTKDQSSAERKQAFLTALSINTQAFDHVVVSTDYIAMALRSKLINELQLAVEQQLAHNNTWSFDNLITHLANALQGEQGIELTQELRQRFSAALIDEFQDTDNQQWSIFSTVFATTSHYLMLVGDPKQAIYKFRGADIYSYLAAQQQAQYRYTLTHNWRSHPLLVNGVNRLFAKQEVFLLPEIGFTPVSAARTEDEGTLLADGRRITPIVLWQLPETSDHSDGYWSNGKAADAIIMATVDEILRLLNNSVTLSQQQNSRNLAPQDIAILVRSNQQAQDFHHALKLAGIPSVLTSNASVFQTEEAGQLYVLLDALLHPGETSKLSQALALDWFGYDGQALYQLLNDDSKLDGYIARFANYYQLWQRKGLMPMLQHLFQHENIVKVLTQSTFAERRLTNIQHLLELLQQAVLDEHLGLHKTLAWFRRALTRPQTNAENQQLRLESDADAVKIVTMHRSKGLEYAIVFCPFLWQSSHSAKTKQALVQCHKPSPDGTYHLIADLGSAEFDQHCEQAQFEQQAEDVRLAYVAVTRAKYRCYIAWADARSKDEANQSALSWLLSLGESSFAGQQSTLIALSEQEPDIFSYRLLAKTETITSHYQSVKSTGLLKAKPLHRHLISDWQMSSYTALSALSLHDTPELPQDKADERQFEIAVTHVDGLPAGAHTGNVIHELLEKVPFQDLARSVDITELRNQACLRYGLQLTQPKIIDQLLLNVVTTPLSEVDSAFCLMNLPDKHCLKEMPFYLSLTSVNTNTINQILQNEATFQALSAKQISGYLTGFVDLIGEYDGRYYVMDYKTNNLPDYRPETLIDAMREHNYGLQSWLYGVVLHRYLQNRLSNYSYERHFGGVCYLFVRGMQPNIPMSGVFQDIPSLIKLEALSALFED